MAKTFTKIGALATLAVVVNGAQAYCQERSHNDAETMKTFFDDKRGIEFRYPQSLALKPCPAHLRDENCVACFRRTHHRNSDQCNAWVELYEAPFDIVADIQGWGRMEPGNKENDDNDVDVITANNPADSLAVGWVVPTRAAFEHEAEDVRSPGWKGAIGSGLWPVDIGEKDENGKEMRCSACGALSTAILSNGRRTAVVEYMEFDDDPEYTIDKVFEPMVHSFRFSKPSIPCNDASIAASVNTLNPVFYADYAWPDLARTPDYKYFYIGHCHPDYVKVVTISTGIMAAMISGNMWACPSGVAVTPNGSRAYITNADANNVRVIDTATNTVATTIPVGNSPKSIVIMPEGTKAYVANVGSRTVTPITISDNVAGTPIPVGRNPRVRMSRDGSLVYVTNKDDHTVSVISTACDTIISTFPQLKNADFE